METHGNSNETGRSSFEGERQNLKHKARDTADRARHQVRSLADSGRNQIASQLSEISKVLRDTSEKLREDEQSAGASRITDMLADRADQASRFFEEHDADELLNRVEDIARKNPGLFLGGCVAIGLAIGRFLKASPSSSGGGEEEQLPLGVSESEGRGERGETVYEYDFEGRGEDVSAGVEGKSSSSETSGTESKTYEAGSTGGMGGFQGVTESSESEEERKRREAQASGGDEGSSKKTEVIEVETSGSGYVQPIITTKSNGESGER